jgi:two-component system nitrogen regulation sensor histidine kinase GlnL
LIFFYLFENPYVYFPINGKVGLFFARREGMAIETPLNVALEKRILENLSTSVIVLNRGLEITYINPACEMLFEISRKKAFGLGWSQLILGPESLAERIRTSLEDGHPFTEREVHLDLFGNRVLTVDCIVTPVYDVSEKSGLLIELQHIDRQIRISKEENLISQNQATRELIRGVAHEIKNPLGGLRGAAQLLEKELDENLKEYTRIIIDEADRLQTLVNQMLGPNALPKKMEINIHQILERVRNLVMVDLPKNVSIHRDYDPSIPEVFADPDQMIQTVLNLVQNAIQAIGDEEGDVTVRTRAKRQFTIGQQRHKLVLMIEVIDNGPGIPDEMMDKIFLPMITGRANGTGLGLSIAQSMMNRHNGLIECSSKPGRTIFRILLPLENEHGK